MVTSAMLRCFEDIAEKVQALYQQALIDVGGVPHAHEYAIGEVGMAFAHAVAQLEATKGDHEQVERDGDT